MIPPTRRVALTRIEVEYLKAASFLTPALLASLRSAQWSSSELASLELSPTTAEEFRDALTERLARVGFDESYGLTAEGKILEDLIDHFHSS